MRIRITSLVLLLCMLFAAFALTSCGNKSENGNETTPATTPATEAATNAATQAATEGATSAATQAATEAATNPATEPSTEPETEPATEPETTVDPELKWEKIVPKVTMIAERDRQIKIEYSTKVSAEKGSKNDIYLQGPDTVVEDVTPKIQQMIYYRNKAASDLLQATVSYVSWDITYGEQAGQINTVVQGGASDAPDLFVNMIYDLNNELIHGSFKDVTSIPNGYFYFDEPGWLKTWMMNMSFTGDRAYILASDYFLDVLRAMSLLPFNMTMMDANAAQLAPAILEEDEELEDGEPLTPYFFDLVEEGDWTWEVLGKLCEAIYVDVDGDGTDSINDRLGIIADLFGGINAASFLYSSGEALTEAYIIEDESSEYNNKQWIKYVEDSTAMAAIFEAVKGVFEGKGSLATSYTFKGNSPTEPGSAYHHTKFGKGELLFGGVCLLGTLEDEAFQEMEDLYSVVPCPKVDSEKDYNTIIVNQGDAGAINVNSNPRKTRVLSAFLQHCTEHSPAIRHEFLQIVTKYKTTTYDQGTDRMLDIIYDGVLYGRDKTVDDLVNLTRWHSLLKTDKLTGGADLVSEQYQTARDAKQAKLDDYMKTWYTLPKS